MKWSCDTKANVEVSEQGPVMCAAAAHRARAPRFAVRSTASKAAADVRKARVPCAAFAVCAAWAFLALAGLLCLPVCAAHAQSSQPVYAVYFHVFPAQPLASELHKVRSHAVRLCDMLADSGAQGELADCAPVAHGHYVAYRNSDAHCLYRVYASEQQSYPLGQGVKNCVSSDVDIAGALESAAANASSQQQGIQDAALQAGQTVVLHVYRYYALQAHVYTSTRLCKYCSYRAPASVSVGASVSGTSVRHCVGGLAYRLKGKKSARLVGFASKRSRVLKIPASVRIDGKLRRVTSIGKRAFAKCALLRKVRGGANICSIGARAFAGCSKLRSVTVRSKTLAHIGRGAFKKCSSLSTFRCSSIGLSRRMLARAGLL